MAGPSSARRPLRTAFALASAALVLGGASYAAAQAAGNGAATAPAPAPRIVEVRLAMSQAAAENLIEPRMRRLLEIELEDSAVLAPGAGGPLGDHVAYVWIDLVGPSGVLVEVRVGDRSVGRRELSAAGLGWDVAARFVAVAAAEMVRAQMRPVRTKKPPPPKPPSPAEIERASRDASGLAVWADASMGVMPSADAVVVGPGVSFGFRGHRAVEGLYARWLSGPAGDTATRWLEAGGHAGYRLWLSPAWRVELGARFGVAAVRLADARAVDGVWGEQDGWSARLAGGVAAERKLAPWAWLGLALEPGVLLRSISFEDVAAKSTALEGAWLGASLSLEVHP